jgi:hypothetical protein
MWDGERNVEWAERSEAHADFAPARHTWARRSAPLPTLKVRFSDDQCASVLATL